MILARKVKRLGKFLHVTHYYVQCKNCGYVSFADTEQGAIDNWNRENDPEEADVWISEIKKKFWVMRCPEEEKVNLVMYMLQKRTDCWWQSF